MPCVTALRCLGFCATICNGRLTRTIRLCIRGRSCTAMWRRGPAVSQIVPFTTGDPFTILLVEFESGFRRTDLREILRRVREEIRQRAKYGGRKLDEIVFVCATENYGGIRFAHFEMHHGWAAAEDTRFRVGLRPIRTVCAPCATTICNAFSLSASMILEATGLENGGTALAAGVERGARHQRVLPGVQRPVRDGGGATLRRTGRPPPVHAAPVQPADVRAVSIEKASRVAPVCGA